MIGTKKLSKFLMDFSTFNPLFPSPYEGLARSLLVPTGPTQVMSHYGIRHPICLLFLQSTQCRLTSGKYIQIKNYCIYNFEILLLITQGIIIVILQVILKSHSISSEKEFWNCIKIIYV